MSSVIRAHVVIMIVLCAMVLAGVASIERANAQQVQPPPRKSRVIFHKPAKTTFTAAVRPDSVIVKFQEGTHIRVRARHFVFDPAILSPDEQARLARGHVDPDTVQRELIVLNRLLQQPHYHFARLFTRPEPDLDGDKQRGEQASVEELADLDLYYTVQITDALPDATMQFIDQLNALSIVEIAYAQPIDRSADIAPVTPDFSGNQGYLDAASNGIDARYAWTIGGGRGNGVRVIDVELGWQLDHEDLPTTFYNGGVQSASQDNRNHGTAVLGEIAALDDGHGVTGIAPSVGIGVASNNSRGTAAGINDAAGQLCPGDIILVEAHAQGPSSGLTCNDGNCTQWEYIAMEYWQAEYDAIHSATANGIIVVEAAGNGGMDLDSTIYEGRYVQIHAFDKRAAIHTYVLKADIQ